MQQYESESFGQILIKFAGCSSFSALTLMVGRQEGIWPVNSWVFVCWLWWFHYSFACLIAPLPPPPPSSFAPIASGISILVLWCPEKWLRVVVGWFCVGVDAWSSIPDEIFLAVFAHLSKSTLGRCARVCKRWRRLAYVITRLAFWLLVATKNEQMRRWELETIVAWCTVKSPSLQLIVHFHYHIHQLVPHSKFLQFFSQQ